LPVNYQFYQTNLNRRFLLKALVLLTYFKSSLSYATSKKSGTFKQTWILKNNSKDYPSLEKFWNDNSDPIAYQLNALFRQNGWLVKDMSSMKNSKTAVLTKEYYNKHYFNLYNKLWEKLSDGDLKEGRNLQTQTSNRHLF